MLNDEKVPEPQKRMIRSHMQGIDDSRVPLDTSGSPLMKLDQASLWIDEAEQKPEHFGKHKLEAFMKTHHQNLQGWNPTDWNQVNDYLDRAKELQGGKSEFEKAIEDNIERNKDEEE